MYTDKEYRIDLMKGMNALVISLNNEDAYYNHWIYLVPDDVTDEELEEIALDDELFEDVIKLFIRIMKRYLKDGLYILDKLYL